MIMCFKMTGSRKLPVYFVLSEEKNYWSFKLYICMVFIFKINSLILKAAATITAADDNGD